MGEKASKDISIWRRPREHTTHIHPTRLSITSQGSTPLCVSEYPLALFHFMFMFVDSLIGCCNLSKAKMEK
jgi:hypothetical protein